MEQAAIVSRVIPQAGGRPDRTGLRGRRPLPGSEKLRQEVACPRGDTEKAATLPAGYRAELNLRVSGSGPRPQP
jgi:hypothetical protein